MRRIPSAFLLSVLAVGVVLLSGPQPARANSAPVVTNVVAAQVPGTGTVIVTYDVTDADNDQLIARVIFSSDNGATYNLPAMSLSGAVNQLMYQGAGKQITWNAAADHPGRYWPQVKAKVTVSDGPASAGEMVLVPAGNFSMGGVLGEGDGDELPNHTVYLNAFYMDKFEVTNGEFKQFMDAGGYVTQEFWSAEGWAARNANGWIQPRFWGLDDYRSGPSYPGFPVIGVTWYEAEAYASYVGKRLPTEAEWEKAARGTFLNRYPFPDEGDVAHHCNVAGSGDPYESGSAQITPVGFYDGRSFPDPPYYTFNAPSPYGAYDMGGNVWEWVSDWYQSDYYSVSPSSNPPGPSTGTDRVLRGGSWWDDYMSVRCANRDSSGPTSYGVKMGFRCAR